MPTRAEAFEAFLRAVDLCVPAAHVTERDRIRTAGVHYAHAAAQEVLAEWHKAVQEAVDDRHLLDGTTAQTNRVTEEPSAPDTRRDDLRLDAQIYGGVGDEHDLDEGSKQ